MGVIMVPGIAQIQMLAFFCGTEMGSKTITSLLIHLCIFLVELWLQFRGYRYVCFFF